MPTQNRAGNPHQQVRPAPDTVPARERMRMPQIVRWITKHDFDAAPYSAVQERALVYLPGVLGASGVRVAGGSPPQWIDDIADFRFVSEIELMPYGPPLWHVVAEKGDESVRGLWVPAEDLRRAWRATTPESASIAITGELPTVVVGEGLRLGPELARAVELLKEIWPPDGKPSFPPGGPTDYAMEKALKARGVSLGTSKRAVGFVRPKQK
jgi:hypothetical protein